MAQNELEAPARLEFLKLSLRLETSARERFSPRLSDRELKGN
jgi:hypothetical protein